MPVKCRSCSRWGHKKEVCDYVPPVKKSWVPKVKPQMDAKADNALNTLAQAVTAHDDSPTEVFQKVSVSGSKAETPFSDKVWAPSQKPPDITSPNQFSIVEGTQISATVVEGSNASLDGLGFVA
ncbi:hypothetical protein Droror1_Dr00016228 [Drosera rotundifolia]